jgi:DnaK suppressor protein
MSDPIDGPLLTPEQIEQIRSRLGEAAEQLMANAESSLRMSMDREADTGRDSIDLSVTEWLLSTDLRLRDREMKLLFKVRKALVRLEDGEIGECEDCGEEIGFKRLLARPVTSLCIHCKESREEQERQEGDDGPPAAPSFGRRGI